MIVSRDVRVDEAIKYTPNTAENMIPIGSRKIITILEQDIDEQDIEELMREKQEEHQIDIVDENDITLPVKNIKEGLPTPPPSDRAVDQSGLTTTPTITGTTTPQSTQSSYFSPSPQRHEPVPEAVPIRIYNRRPTEQQVVANLRPARSGRTIRPTNKAAGKAFATTIDTIDV